MTARVDWAPGAFVYLDGGAYPFSGGVAAADGYMLTRASFRTPPPLAEGFAIAADVLAAQRRPPGALAACELRSPAPLSGRDFAAFNDEYRAALRVYGFGADDAFPIARSNLAPLFDAPATVTLSAFAYTMPAERGGGGTARDFVVSGQPELVGDPPVVIAPGDVSAAGLTRKASAVLAALRRRVDELGVRWSDLTALQVYSVHSFDAVRDVVFDRALGGRGVTLVLANPPVIGFDFEADARSVTLERVL